MRYPRNFGNLKKYFPLLFILAFLPIFWNQVAQAAMVKPVDQFQDIAPNERVPFNSIVSKLLDLENTQNKLFIAHIDNIPSLDNINDGSKQKYRRLVFLRIEFDDCKNYACLTFLFWENVSIENYIGTAFLTRVFNTSDIIYPLCPGCKNTKSINFYYKDKVFKNIFIYYNGIVF